MAVRVTMLACRHLCVPPGTYFPRLSLTHHPTPQANIMFATGKHNVLPNFSRVFHVCHMCSGRICSIGGSANSGILWQLLIGLQSARHWTQGTLDDVDPLGHPHKVSFWLFGQKHSQYWPAGGNFVGLWQCSSWSSLHKKIHTSYWLVKDLLQPCSALL